VKYFGRPRPWKCAIQINMTLTNKHDMKKNNKLQNVTLNGQCISGDTECNLETIGHI